MHPKEEREDRNGQYSLAHLTSIDCSAPELVYLAARAGYDGISPRFIPMKVAGEFPCFPEDKQLVAATKHALAVTGLKVFEIELARITEDCNPSSFEHAMALGAELGARHLLVSAWTQSRDDRNFIVDTYGEICTLAKQYELSVDIEFMAYSRIRSLDEAIDIVRAANPDNGGILIDTLHAYVARTDIGEISHIPEQWLHFIHICDTLPGIPDTKQGMILLARDARLYPGEGCVDFSRIVKRMPPIHYTIELPNKSRITELGYEEHARRCLQHAKQKLSGVVSERTLKQTTLQN